MADFFGPLQGVVPNNKQCYLPMPMKEEADIGIIGLPNDKPATAEFHGLGNHTGQFDGWGKRYSVGPHLNLTYVYRHVIHKGACGFLGSEPRAIMASTKLVSPKSQPVTLRISYDDPVETWFNGRPVTPT